MTNGLRSGAHYFATVFAAAFVLGIVRVVLLAPTVGALWATLIELPFTLGLSWALCGWISRAVGVRSFGAAFTMGASAFVLLMGAEALGAVVLFKRSLADHWGTYATLAGALGFAGQIAFGAFPIIQYFRRQAPRS